MLTLWAQGQILLNKNDLPILSKRDTIAFNCEAWIEDPNSEMKQRLLIVKLEKKIDKTLDILRKKEGYELQIDSLIFEAEKVRKEKDSLLDVISHHRFVTNKKIEQRINFLANQITSIKEQYFRMRKSRNLWRRTGLASILVNGFLVVLLL